MLRLGPGADLILFNGEGGEWQATIEVLERGRVGVRVGSHRPAERESPLHLTLAQGISRGERMDYTPPEGRVPRRLAHRPDRDSALRGATLAWRASRRALGQGRAGGL